MAVFKFDKLKCPMSKVQSPKLKKNLKIIAKIFAQFNYFLYLCNVVERQQKRAFKP